MCVYFEQAACPPCACVRVVLWSWSWLAPSNVELKLETLRFNSFFGGKARAKVEALTESHMNIGLRLNT